MAFEQVREVIERAQLFHHKLSEFYAQAEGLAHREKVRMVLDYLRWHERAMEERLRDFVRDGDDLVMSTWFKYTPDDHIHAVLRRPDIDPGMTVDEVIHLALEMDDALLEFYLAARDLAAIPEVREVFDGLYKESMKERAKLVLALMPFD